MPEQAQAGKPEEAYKVLRFVCALAIRRQPWEQISG